MKRILYKNCLGEYELRDKNYRIIATGTLDEMLELHILFLTNEGGSYTEKDIKVFTQCILKKLKLMDIWMVGRKPYQYKGGI